MKVEGHDFDSFKNDVKQGKDYMIKEKSWTKVKRSFEEFKKDT